MSTKELLKTHLAELNTEHAEILAEWEPIHEAVAKHQVDIDAIKAKQRKEAQKKDKRLARFIELSGERSAVAKALGGKSMSE